MKYPYIVVLCCVLGCSQTDRSIPTKSSEARNRPSITLENLVYVDLYSGDQRPLVCGAGRDFPTGHEFTFRQVESSETIHAVFPASVTPPETFDGKFVLCGHFQGIQNIDHYKFKQPGKDYQYLVVSSWER